MREPLSTSRVHRDRRFAVPYLLIAAVVVAVLAPSSAFDDSFYAGKTLRILVAIGPGGGLDTEARVLGRHLSRHVPGAPRVIVDNVPGAGGLVAANMFARTIKADGLTLGYFTLAPLIAQLIGDPAVQFDVRKFEFIGSPYPDRPVCILSSMSGVTSIDAWKASRRPMKLGSTGPTSVLHVYPALLRSALHLPMQIVSGYRGSAEIRLALASGELDGVCMGWDGTRVGWPAGTGMSVIVQAGSTPHPGLPLVPLAVSLAGTPEARELLSVPVEALMVTGRPYAFPPGVNGEARTVLRQAFLDTMRDPAYIAEARVADIAVEPISGDAVTGHVHALLALSPSFAAKFKQLIAR